MRNRILLFYFMLQFCIGINLSAQMQIGGTTLYGNEWIDYDKEYYEIPIAEDGLYKLTAEDLQSAGLELSEFQGKELAIIHYGKAIPLYVSNGGTWTSEDFLLFKGEKNRAFMDQFLYEGGKEWLLNKDYSLINDTSSYYLVVDEFQALRYDKYSNVIDASKTPKAWHLYTDKQVFHDYYHKTYHKSGYVSYYVSHFIKDEGWASRNVRTRNINFHPSKVYLDSLQAELSVKLVSDYDEHDLSVKINGKEVVREELGSFDLREYTFPLTEEQIKRNRLRLRIRGEINGRDRYSVVYATLRYARETVSVDGKYFSDSLTENRYYAVRGIDGSDAAWVLSGTHLFHAIPQSGNQIINGSKLPVGEKIEVFSTGAVKDAMISASRRFKNYDLEDTELIFLTSQSLVNSVPSLIEYKAYRESVAGGDFTTAIVTVEELYDQFAYGIKRHPMAIKNFFYYLDNLGTSLKYVFIVGKGIDFIESRTAEDFESPLIQEFRVPTFGYPSSDDLLASPLDRTEPLYAIGRLPYNTEEEIALYLDKVKANEASRSASVADNLWKKRVLHLNGGGAEEYEIIKWHFKNMRDICVESTLNPHITTYAQTSNAPIQFSAIEGIFNEINKGLKLVTFFGHSSSVSLSFDLTREKSYDNYDKMPFLIALGCSAGNLNIPGESLGEIYGSFETGGFIGVWASTHFAFISPLSVIGQNFYKEAFNNTEGLRLGMLVKEAIKASKSYRRMSEQMMLMGDPALKFAIPQGPDIALDAGSVSHEPERPTISTDSIVLEFVVSNLGIVSEDSVLLDYVHTLPDGKQVRHSLGYIAIPDYKDSLQITIPVDSTMAGFNSFNVRLNADKALKEWPDSIAYSNNEFIDIGFSGGYEVYIQDNHVRAVYPMDYAIVPVSQPELVFSGAPYVHDSTYVIIEMDTTELFNSPEKIHDEFFVYGGTRRWKVPKEIQDSTVYYWRVKSGRLAEIANSKWEEHSFIYLEGKTGWNQSHYYQFMDDGYEGMYLSEDRRFIQDSTVLSFHIDNKINQNNEGILISYNGQRLNQSKYWLPRFSGAYFHVLSEKNLSIVSSCPPGGKYGAINTRNFALRTFPYDVRVDSSRIALMNYLDNVVQDGRYVIFIIHEYQLSDSFNVEEWQADSLINDGKNIFNVLESYGAKKIRAMKQGTDLPYIFMFQKGTGRVFAEAIGQSEIDAIGATADFSYPQIEGIVHSTSISGFKSYDRLEYQIEKLDTSDYNTISVLPQGDSTILATDSASTYNIINIDSIVTSVHPYLSMQWLIGNAEHNDLPQIQYWRIYGERYGDYALSSGKLLADARATIRNFDTLRADFYIHNISFSTLDTGTIVIKLTDKNNQVVYSDEYAIESSIEPFDSLYQTLNIPINTKSDLLKLEIQLLTPDSLHERILSNNILFKNYRIIHDKIGPTLSVYFNGYRIENGDIIPHKSRIEVLISDKSEVIPLSDTSNIEFNITDPDGNLMNYTFASANVDFIPANPFTAQLVIQGNFKEEGLYTFQVNASDKSGNPAGSIAYQVQFRIVLKDAISYFVNYPNPFTSSTQFLYTLTTDEVPPDYKMTIVNASGELVAELGPEQLGALRVGTHSTLPWNGRGTEGQVLPPGVYFYRLTLNGKSQYSHISNPFDKYFKHEWGKFMIVR